MKLGWNLAAGFANSFWSAIVALAAVPFYLRYLGIEAYGLIGFFAAMQALFALFDMGLTTTINREVARNSVADDRSHARDLLHTLAFAYWIAAGLIAAFTFAAAPLVSDYWLSSSKLPPKTVEQGVMLMGVIVALRFPLGLYVGALLGAQRMVAASSIEIAMVTLANVGAVAMLAFVSPTIQTFFLWQAFAALLNVILVRAATWRVLRGTSDERRPRFDAAGLKRIWRFSAGMGLTALLGTIFMQSDKVILSKIVSLGELGRYTLAGLAARSLYLFVTPVFSAIYPRLTSLHASGETREIATLYKSGTRLLAAVIFAFAAFVAVFSGEIFTLWTGDATLAKSVHLIVDFLLLGTALNAVMHFPYALQLAYGKSNLPALINLVLLVVFAPLVIVLALKYGITGGAAAWAVLNILYLFLGTWVTHRTLLPSVGLGWIAGDVGMPLVAAVVVTGAGGYAVRRLDLSLFSHLVLGLLLVAAAFLLVVVLSPNLARRARQLRARYF